MRELLLGIMAIICMAQQWYIHNLHKSRRGYFQTPCRDRMHRDVDTIVKETHEADESFPL